MRSENIFRLGNLGRTPPEPRDKSTAQAANDRLFSAPPTDIRSAADYKALRTLAAEYALAGYELIDEVGINGARRLYAVRHGQTQHFDSIHAARAHLERVP